MAFMLETILNLTPEQKFQVEREIGPLRTTTEFFSSLLEATKDNSIRKQFVNLLPWAVKGGRLPMRLRP